MLSSIHFFIRIVNMNTIIKTLVNKILIGIVTGIICMLLLLCVCLMPENAIRANVSKSADYYVEKGLYPYLVERLYCSCQDNYADSILTNVIYNMVSDDGNNLFSRVITAKYYNPLYEDVDISLNDYMNMSRDEVSQINEDDYVQYFRYWHGSAVVLIPLFTVFDIVAIRIILGVVAISLMILVAIMLFKDNKKSLAISALLAMVILNIWMIAACVEYVTTFIVAGIISILTIRICRNGKKDNKQKLNSFINIMIISGIVCAFVDFLTTETITVTIPAIIFLAYCGNTELFSDIKLGFINLIKPLFAWGVGYACMFIFKWCLSVIVLGGTAFTEALSSAENRLTGVVYNSNTNLSGDASLARRIVGCLGKNMAMLYQRGLSFNFGAMLAITLLLFFVCFGIVYLFRTKDFGDKYRALAGTELLLIGIIPYVRYLVLSNHAYIHFFFTYRAQMATLIVVFVLTWELGIKEMLSYFHTKKSKRRGTRK